ncbi:MAG: response regulator, partial [Deltaproteobacteria bacterium]
MLTSFGKKIYVEYVISTLFVKEKPHLLVIGRDITEEKILLDKNRKIEAQMLHVQKLESMGVLAGGIAHDFNNILLAILGNAELALMRLNPESTARNNLLQIEKAAQRAADLAQQMLAYSGRGQFVIESLDINALITEMNHILEVSISKKALMRLNLANKLPLFEGDATQIRQIIMNLVINASEAIGDENGVIAVSTGLTECDQTYLSKTWLYDRLKEGTYVYFEIADTGCGMSHETLSKIFDPFFTTKFTGRGLGMAAVLGIVRGHKGAMEVYSEPDKGTTFKILLPATGKSAEGLSHVNLSENWRGTGTVLLVDDEETVRDIGTEMLKELGFEVITAVDGRHAVELFNCNPDIKFVILDLTMPQMDGEQCFRELIQIKPDVKVLMSSGFNEQEVTQKFTGKGLSGFLQKPYKLSALKEVITRL